MNHSRGLFVTIFCTLSILTDVKPQQKTTTTTTSSKEIACSLDEFLCDETKCIPNSSRCNRRRDCLDFSDEADCNIFEDCFPLEVQCNTTKLCIFKTWLCDNVVDCPDGGDEEYCPGEPGSCGVDKFMCDDGLCLDKKVRCNTLVDCLDRGDEENCTRFREPEICEDHGFECVSDGVCISRLSVCNLFEECADGSDELDCNKNPCEPNEFRCKSSGYCLLKDMICDGHEDCFDASDEDNCPENSNSRCPISFFWYKGRCLTVSSFPRSWSRSKHICRRKNSRLARLETDRKFLRKLRNHFIKRSLQGINYWVGEPTGAEDEEIPRRSVNVPFGYFYWKTRSRFDSLRRRPHCYFLDFETLAFYRSPDCYTRTSSICEYDVSDA